MRDKWICELDWISMIELAIGRMYDDGSVDVSEDIVCGC